MLIDSEYKNPKMDDYVLSVIDGCANLKSLKKIQKLEQLDCFLNPKS